VVRSRLVLALDRAGVGPRPIPEVQVDRAGIVLGDLRRAQPGSRELRDVALLLPGIGLDGVVGLGGRP
jgi:hypothetical protein